MPNQYHNQRNPEAHYATTGPEIWNQTNGCVTHVIVGAGSCGTISGVGKYLKEKNKDIVIVGVDAATSAYSSEKPRAYDVEGIGIDIADNLMLSVIDTIIPVSDADVFAMTKKLARTYGLMVGLSSGAVMHVTMDYAKRLKPTDLVVVVFADSGRSYLKKAYGV